MDFDGDGKVYALEHAKKDAQMKVAVNNAKAPLANAA